MNTDLLSRAAELLVEALALLDRAEAPPEIGARLNELVLLTRAISLMGDEERSKPAA